MIEHLFTCENLSFSYTHQKIFSNFSCHIKEKESLCIVGENGSGKTTLLKILSGLLRPTKGKVFCCGEEIWPNKNITFEHKSIYLSYTPSFYLDQSVLANLDFYLKCYGMEATLKAKQLTLDAVRLIHKQNATMHSLSTGQKRRLTLAAISLLKPKIVFADEPTNGLDTHGTKLCLEVFDELMRMAETSFVIATHDDVMKKWAHKSIFLPDFK